MDEYSNSHKSKEQEKAPKFDKKKVNPITKGKTAPVKKKGELRKFAEVFLAEDIANVKEYFISDVIRPTLQKAIYDIGTNGLNAILYGRGRSGGGTNAGRTNYRDCYKGSPNNSAANTNSVRAGSYEFKDIVVDSRRDAEDVLASMQDMLDHYGTVSVADMYDLVGVTGQYTDNRYGWTDIRTAAIVSDRDGWRIKMPKAVPLRS